MSVLKELEAKLKTINMKNFFYETSDRLTEVGLIVIEPHKNEGNKFYSLIGLIGDNSSETFTIDVIHDDRFIKFATMELTVMENRGVSLVFFVDSNALFSYITFSLLKDNEVFFAEADITTDEDSLIEIVQSIQKIRNKVDRLLRIEKKRIKKTYLSKCRTMMECDINGQKKYSEGWKDGLKNFLSFMKKLK